MLGLHGLYESIMSAMRWSDMAVSHVDTWIMRLGEFERQRSRILSGGGQFTPGQYTPGRFTPGQLTPGQFTPGQFTPGQFTPGLISLNEASSFGK